MGTILTMAILQALFENTFIEESIWNIALAVILWTWHLDVQQAESESDFKQSLLSYK